MTKKVDGKKGRTHYSVEFKQPALRHAQNDGVAVAVAGGAVVRMARPDAPHGQDAQAQRLAQSEAARLKREVARLEEEVAFLKKAAAYFAKLPK